MATERTVNVRVEGLNGASALEELHVEPLGGERYLLLQSPGLALDLAADDVFVVRGDGTYTVVKRGQNVAIQIFSNQRVNDIEAVATPLFSALHGRLDGRSPRQVVYTVPAVAGFPAIERVLATVTASVDDCEWYYGNVYDPVDGVTPLGWWKD